MGQVVVSVVVVGACIAIGTWLAIGAGPDEDATARRRRHRDHPAPPVEVAPLVEVVAPTTPTTILPDRTPWWVRVRSGALLACLSIVLGILTALAVGGTLVVLVTLLRSSVG